MGKWHALENQLPGLNAVPQPYRGAAGRSPETDISRKRSHRDCDRDGRPWRGRGGRNGQHDRRRGASYLDWIGRSRWSKSGHDRGMNCSSVMAVNFCHAPLRVLVSFAMMRPAEGCLASTRSPEASEAARTGFAGRALHKVNLLQGCARCPGRAYPRLHFARRSSRRGGGRSCRRVRKGWLLVRDADPGVLPRVHISRSEYKLPRGHISQRELGSALRCSTKSKGRNL
jgi:hypothetical protein